MEEPTSRSVNDHQTSSNNCLAINSVTHHHQVSNSTGAFHQPVGTFCQTFQAPDSNITTLSTVASSSSSSSFTPIYTTGGESPSYVLQPTTNVAATGNTAATVTNAATNTTTLLPDFLNENYDLYTQSPEASSTYSESSECSSEDVDSENTSTSSSSSPANVITVAVAASSIGSFSGNVIGQSASTISGYPHSMNTLSPIHYNEMHHSQVGHGSYLQSLDQTAHSSSSMRYTYGTHLNPTTIALPLSSPSPLYPSMDGYAYRTTDIYSTNDYTTDAASNPHSCTSTSTNATTITVTSPSSVPTSSNEGYSMNYFSHSITPTSESIPVEQQHYTDLSESIASSKSAECINGLLNAANSIVNELNSLSPVLETADDPHSSNSEDSSSSASIGSTRLDNLSASGESSQNDLSAQKDNFFGKNGEIIKSSIVESVTA